MGILRIVGGEFKGRRIFCPSGRNVRPTSDRVREALFSILGGDLSGTVVADLYAGSGAFGLEALSRGAEKAFFVESDRKVVKVIRNNIRDLKVDNKCVVFNAVLPPAVTMLDKNIDIVFMDPPYADSEGWVECVRKLFYGEYIKKDGVLVAERSKNAGIPVIEGIAVERVKEYGDTVLVFFKGSGR